MPSSPSDPLLLPSNLLPNHSLPSLLPNPPLSHNVPLLPARPRLAPAPPAPVPDLQPSPFLNASLPTALPPLDFDSPHPLAVPDDLLFPQPPPTMHPNLVSTLRLIISPMSPAQSFTLPEAPEDVQLPARSDDCRLRCSGLGRIGDLGEDRCLTAGAHKPQTTLSGSFKRPEDQLQAAIVPIDLIQNKRPFLCASPGCNKTFKNPQTLKMHYKTHNGENSACGKGVRSPAMFPPSCRAGHNKKIPSKCPVCRRTFVGLYELRRHFGRKHSEGEKSHGCKKCGKKFYIEVDLRDHEKLCGEPLECSCGMKFAFKCNLVAHKKSHPDCQDFPGEEEGRTAAGSLAGAQDSFHSGSFSSQISTREAFHPGQVTNSQSFLALGQPPASCSLSSIPQDTPLRSISCGVWPCRL